MSVRPASRPMWFGKEGMYLSVCVYVCPGMMNAWPTENVEISKDDKFRDLPSVPIDAPPILLDWFRCLFVCFYQCSR